MEAHAGTVRIPVETTTKPRRRRLRLFLAAARARRRERAVHSHELRASGITAPSVQGSEHAHLLRPRGY
jgi:hypothetical protein